MGYMPVNRLLVTMALPMMASMLVMALYNVVDSIFVARLSEAALTAVSVSFPMQNLFIGVAVGTGIGVNALLSKSLGEKNFDQADRTAQNALFLAAVSGLVGLLFGLLGVRLYFRLQIDDPVILEYGVQYLFICSVGSIALFLQVMNEKLLLSTGKTVYSMLVQLSGSAVNLILDPIMIFGLAGCPAMGIRGAALATVLGQAVAACVGLCLNVKVNREIHILNRHFKPSRSTIGRIYSVGIPSILMQSVGSVMTFAMNRILVDFSSTAVAVFGVYFKLQSFFFMPVFGINNGMVPILSFNYGARQPERITHTIRLAVGYAMLIMTLGFASFQLFPAGLLKMFSASDDMLGIGVTALRIISLSFIPAGFCIITCSVFQALGKGYWAMAASVGRQLVVLVPAAWLLSLAGRVELVWWSFPLAEVVSVALCAFFLHRIYKRIIHPLELSVRKK